jgi:hypothetical protein
MSNYWKKIDGIEKQSISNFQIDDECFYAHDFLPSRGFQGGLANNNVLNFKKAPSTPGQNYRTGAIYKFALDASSLIDCESGKTYAVTAIPSSKCKSDPLYDNRFEDFFIELAKLRPCIDIQWPVINQATVTPSHSGGSRTPATIAASYTFKGFTGNAPEFILVFDDVLTTGAHFRAFKDFLIQSGYRGRVFGLFWTKTK